MKRNFTRILAAFALLVGLTIPMGVWGQTRESETITFADLGLENGVQYTDPFGTNISVTFAGGDNDGKYYTTGSGIRTYGDGTITITANDNTVTAISTTFSGVSYAPASTDVWSCNGTTTNSTSGVNASWSGSATEVVMTRPSGSGHWRMQAITVTYTAGGSTPTTYNVTVNQTTGGTIAANPTQATAGTTITLTATPDDDYIFGSWSIDPSTVTITDNQFTMPASDVTVSAQWTENTTPTPEGETATLNIQAYADANSWENGTKYEIATVSPVTFTANGGGNTGKYYTSGEEWRFYQTESASITISVSEGYTLVSVQPTYNVSNNGVLKNGNSTIASGSTVSVSGTSVTFTVGNSGSATNGQVKFTNIDVVYVSDGGTQTASDLTITNQSTDLTFDLYNNTTAQVISYTTSSTGAITITPAESDYFSYVHDAAAKTITVTPTAVTPSAQTVTISQEADDDYYAGTATFTVSITNSAPLANIAALTAQTIASTYNVALSDAVVTYVNGNYAYIQDASGAVVMYKSGHGLTAGDVLNGTATVTYQVRNGNPQITDLIGVTPVSGTAPDPTEVAASAWNYTFSNVLSQYFKVTGTTITQDNNKYYVSLNNESIQLYKVGTAISGLDLTKTYSITGFPTMYNTTKELQIFVDPEVEASTEPSITVESNVINVDAESHQDYLNISFVNFEPTTGYAFTCDANGTFTDYSWLVAELDINNNRVRYTIGNNEEVARTGYFRVKCGDVYSEIVTVNQAAYVPPFEPATYIPATEINPDKRYIIVGFNDGDAYAMGYQKTNNRHAVEISFDGTTATVETSEVYELVIANQGDYYTIYDERTPGFLYAASDEKNWLRTEEELDDDGNGLWNITFGEQGLVDLVAVNTNVRNVMQFNAGNSTTDPLFACYASANQEPVYLYEKVESAEYTLEITGYTDDSEKTGYHLIASPVFVDPYLVGMADGDFDLYSFDQSEEEEWRNYVGGSFTMLEPGKGYLYAKKATDNVQTYYFNLSGTPYVGDGYIDLAYDANEGVSFHGLNLIGNPFGEEATLNIPYYRMNSTGSGLEAVNETESPVNVMEGVFVYAEYNSEYGYVTNYAQFTPNGNTSGGGGMKINLSRNRGTAIDNAIVRFDEGQQLPKFQLFENSTKLYIPQGNKDFAIVRSAAQGEMPVSFRASENGTYTIAVEAENVDMNYLHLIDNMTGADVDLLATPNYTFEARTNDYTSRFRLVFSANGIDEQNAETFAFFNGTSWTVSNTGDATLQVVDITGRIVSSETINGNATVSLNQPAGIYMLRLVNGNDVKVQKVVVR